MRAVNETEESLGLSCNFREFFGGKQQPGGRSVTAEIAGGEYEKLTVRLQPRQYDSVMNATCKLSKGIAVEATKVDVGNCSIESLFGHWTYTASFDYEGFELGIIRFDANGVYGEVIDDTGEIVVAQGAFTVEDYCGAEIQLTTKYAEVTAVGVIAQDRQTFQGVGLNNRGLYKNFILTRVDIDETIEAVLDPLAKPRQ